MPNKTFDNLPDEKKEAVIHAALKEFTNHDYNSASLNDIIVDIGIAKGSFYRYFDNKQELYNYLINYGLEKKESYVSSYMRAAEYKEDIFTFLKAIMASYTAFNNENEELADFLLKAYFSNNLSRDDFLFMKNGKRILLDRIVVNQKNGILSDHYSSEFIFFCFTQLLMGIPGYIKDSFFCNMNVKRSDPGVKDNVISAVEETFSQLVDFLKNGLTPRN